MYIRVYLTTNIYIHTYIVCSYDVCYIHTCTHTCMHAYIQFVPMRCAREDIDVLFPEDFDANMEHLVAFGTEKSKNVCVYMYTYVCVYIYI